MYLESQSSSNIITHTKTIHFFFLILFAYLLKTIGVLGETRLVQYIMNAIGKHDSQHQENRDWLRVYN